VVRWSSPGKPFYGICPHLLLSLALWHRHTAVGARRPGALRAAHQGAGSGVYPRSPAYDPELLAMVKKRLGFTDEEFETGDEPAQKDIPGL